MLIDSVRQTIVVVKNLIGLLIVVVDQDMSVSIIQRKEA